MFYGRINLQIALWYALAFVAGSIALFALNGFIFISSLQSKDRELLQGKFNEYALIYQRDEMEGVKSRIGDPENSDHSRFIIRLAAADGVPRFMHIPTVIAQHNIEKAERIEHDFRNIDLKESWYSIPGDNYGAEYGDAIEVVSGVLPSGHILQVGKDVEDREEFLEDYSRSFFIGLAPIVAIALLIGGWLSHRLLAPLRWLSATVKSIRSGKTEARVPLRNSADELGELGFLFNQMLDENAQLIEGIKSTLDNVAHDLRTPITRLQSRIEETLRASGSIENYREALAECRENSDGIVKLLDAIMDISEAENGALKLNAERISLSQIVDSAVDLYGFVAESKKITIGVTLSNPVQVRGDRIRLLQAVSNILDNAIKYSPEGSAIELVVGTLGESAFIEVKDNGIGISPKELPKIWDRLYRGDPSRSTRGLGLGLSLVQAIVKAHNGTVNAEPNVASGMVFRIQMPIYAVE